MAFITSGPRFEALRDAYAAAIDAFRQPLPDDALGAGWTEALRVRVLDALRDASLRFEADPDTRLGELEVPDEEASVAEADPLGEALAGIDWCEEDLDVAEDALSRLEAYVVALGRPVEHDDLRSGFTEEVRVALLEVVTTMHGIVAAGDYLSPGVVAAWFEVLGANGVERRALDEPLSSDPFVISTRRGQALDVVAWPKGRRWDELVQFDAGLQALRRRDELTALAPPDEA